MDLPTDIRTAYGGSYLLNLWIGIAGYDECIVTTQEKGAIFQVIGANMTVR